MNHYLVRVAKKKKKIGRSIWSRTTIIKYRLHYIRKSVVTFPKRKVVFVSVAFHHQIEWELSFTDFLITFLEQKKKLRKKRNMLLSSIIKSMSYSATNLNRSSKIVKLQLLCTFERSKISILGVLNFQNCPNFDFCQFQMWRFKFWPKLREQVMDFIQNLSFKIVYLCLFFKKASLDLRHCTFFGKFNESAQ